jgi:hypothetical protein
MFRINRRRLLRSSIALATLETVMCSPALARSLPLAARRKVPGAQGQIEIIDDHLGVPHIRATSKADAFFGQGYVVARDHLFAIDLDYRRRTAALPKALARPSPIMTKPLISCAIAAIWRLNWPRWEKKRAAASKPMSAA